MLTYPHIYNKTCANTSYLKKKTRKKLRSVYYIPIICFKNDKLYLITNYRYIHIYSQKLLLIL